MKCNFRLSAVLSLAVAGMALVASAGAAVVEKARDLVCHAASWLFDLKLFAAPMPQVDTEPESAELPKVGLIRAIAYRLRLVKRERVDVQPRYRMCPST